MHFVCRSFIGKHSDFNWSQYWENEPDDVSIISQKGHLFGLVNFSLDSGSGDISTVGKDIISKLNNFYFSRNESILTSLKSTLDFFKNDLSSQFVQSTLILTIVHQKKAYFACFNTGHVIIQRQDKISQIISGKEYSFENSTGSILPEDKILICTDDFYQNIGFVKLKLALAEKKIQTIEEIFLSDLYTLNNQPNLAGALIEIHFDETESSPFNDEPINNQELFSSVSTSIQNDLPPQTSFIKKIFSKKSDYISHHDVSPIVKRKKINLIIGILLLIGLSISFYFGYQKNQQRIVEAEYQKLKTEINKKISDSVAIKNINLSSALDSAKSANVILEKMQALKVHDTEVQILKKQIDGLLTQTGEAPTASSHDIFLDLKSIIPNAQFNKILYTNDQIFLIDSTSGSIDSVDILTNKTKNIIKSPQVKDIRALVQNSGSIYYLSDNAFYSINQGVPELKIDFNKLNHNITDVSFWNGVLYAFDSSSSKIYKFVPNGSGFDSGSSWLKDGATIDSNTVSLSINSSIWLVSDKGNIHSFTRGIEDKINFSSSNLPTSGKKIISTVNAGIIIIYDNQNLVYLFKNTGELVSKYNFSDKKVNDLTVDEKNNYIYILADDQKIYKVSL